MLKYFTFVVFTFTIEASFAQDLTAILKMPKTVAPGGNYTVEITITKGAINSYIKFSQKLPPQFKATPIEVRGGNFSFDDSIIQIVWFFPPANNEFTFSYKVNVPEDASGVKKIGGKIFYFYNTNREVFSFEKKHITIGTAKANIVSTPVIKVDSILNSTSIKKVDTTLTHTVVITTIDTTVTHITSTSQTPITITKAEQPKDTLVVYKTNTLAETAPTKDTSAAPIIKPISNIVSIKKDTLPATTIIISKAAPTKDTSAALITNVISKTLLTKNTLDTTIQTINKPKTTPTTKATLFNTPTKTENNTDTAAGGLFYCIQLGAFKEEVPLETANKFFKNSARGIKNFKNNNGFTTFTVGNFKTHDEAINLKNEMLEKGFQGAFIVAFPANKKEAPTLKGVNNSTLQGGGQPQVKAEAQTLKVVNNSTLQGVGQTQAKTILEKIIVSAKVPVNIGTSSVNRSYSVQIGAFKEEVPLATANKFLKMSAKKIKNLKDNRDLTVYTVGNFSIRDEAVSLKNEMIAKGFQGAFIITFENGEIVK
jgi:hypothetical protein